MNAILAIPLTLRLACLVALGLVAGGFVNLGVYSLAWRHRSISPWSRSAWSTRNWLDRAPLLGWIKLRRESAMHGRSFWIRPLLVELATALLYVGLYLLEVEWNEPLVLNVVPPNVEFLTANVSLALHVRFFGHAVLATLMLIASLIDIDEKTIPDSITVTGTLVGLGLAVIYPWSLLPAADWAIHAPREIEFLTLASPAPWPDVLGIWPGLTGLVLAMACWTVWCGGLLPRRWNTRRGLWTAVRVFFHRLRVEHITYAIAILWLLGAAAIVVANRQVGIANWTALVTSLVGVAAGGGMVWVVRVLGTAALRREAMGFGDVTLMSMIGAFLGWQPALVIFFLAPFFGLVLAVAERLLHDEPEIPYGPFLCLAALLLLLEWRSIWRETFRFFDTGWLLPAVLIFGMVLMAAMLWVYRVLVKP